MPANFQPIFPLTPKTSSATLTVANFAKGGSTAFGVAGTSPTFSTVFTAGVNGARIDQIKVRSLGLNAATVLRLFVNDGTINSLIHETTLASTGGSGTALSGGITAQTTGTNVFTTTTAPAVGTIVFVVSPSTLTALSLNTPYYVTSTPTSTTFTLSTMAGTPVTVGTTVTGATATATTYATLEQATLVDNDITIAKNTTETAVPIPYLPANFSIRATVGNIGAVPLNMGWAVTVHGADY